MVLAVDQLNRGHSQITDSSLKVTLAHLKSKVTEVYLANRTFFPAMRYLEMGIALLEGEGSWGSHPDEMTDLMGRLAETQTCVGKLEEALLTCADLLDQAKICDKRAQPYICMVECYFRLKRHSDAMK
jgi:hypothetical protein